MPMLQRIGCLLSTLPFSMMPSPLLLWLRIVGQQVLPLTLVLVLELELALVLVLEYLVRDQPTPSC